jgi:hypothetical protein
MTSVPIRTRSAVLRCQSDAQPPSVAGIAKSARRCARAALSHTRTQLTFGRRDGRDFSSGAMSNAPSTTLSPSACTGALKQCHAEVHMAGAIIPECCEQANRWQQHRKRGFLRLMLGEAEQVD